MCICLFMMSEEKLFGQTLSPIQTDRPDQTECPAIVPKGYFQMENGMSYENENDDVRSYCLPSSLLKFGINNKVELRLITELLYTRYQLKNNFGISPLTLGFKVKLSEENGIVPQASFIGHLASPNLASHDLKTSYFAPSFRFVMSNTLSKKVTLGYNLGAEWEGETAEPTFIYTITTGFSLSQKAGAYIEAFGFIPQKNKAEHKVDGGFTYLVSDNFLLDISSGIALEKHEWEYYISAGFSFRFNAFSLKK